ncbi:two-partner secretion domain-containing protein [Megamonas hypermegale]|uniref:two-partner secretion domain-containing protein n=1 Tax=Megamonas hypermegale TaxID=158847 RepID=UPI0026F1A786|nr:filamentous hemagglutinin N-terminal domain-containing protein [Megamonas hypermegale]
MNLDKHRLTKNILVAAIMGASSVQVVVPPSLVYAANQVIPNNTLPTGGKFVGGDKIVTPDGNVMNITQDQVNAVIKWKDFSIGANATVNFNSTVFNDAGEFNTLNYVNGGNLSQIYGTINADKGNIFIVNPAGVEIGNSAQINVGSLYVSNKNLDESKLNQFNGNNLGNLVDTTKTSNAELMSLGNINATNVTFDGDRIVLDVDRIRKPDEKPSFAEPYGKYDPNQLKIYTTDKDKVIVGYTDTNYTTDKGYSNTTEQITVNDNEAVDAYKWVKDYDQLQAIGKDDNHSLDDNFALRNSIDANNKDFNSIGNDTNKFTGNFDGLDYNIYGLTIGKDNKQDNSGLFGVVDGATIGHVNLISGTIIGNNNTGALIGKIDDSGDNITKVENVLNTAQVTGTKNVGGIIGNIGDNRIDEEKPIIEKDEAHKAQLSGLINTGAVSGKENVGGLVGTMNNAILGGTSYNLADISGINEKTITDPETDYSHNIGGLVGSAKYATIGNDKAEAGEVYNHLDVTGGYNVGGIVGSIENSTVQNVSNTGTITATGYDTETYKFHTADNAVDGNDDGIGEKEVQIANVGGIAGKSSGTESIIKNVLNEGDISSSKNYIEEDIGDSKEDNIYYTAGNVGGIVGRAENTEITDAINKEANIRGAHNVGGIAGYFGGNAILTGGINNGGDILATGARMGQDFITEQIRPNSSTSHEEFIIGNMGGIVGYMEGDDTHITSSFNRGTVHTAEITGDSVSDTSKAANIGGIVGKIDRKNTNTLDEIKKAIKNDEKYKEEHNLDVYNEKLISETAVSNSYNTGLVRGYTGVGGVVGMMYNGEVAGSYNIGTVQTTRVANAATIEPLNMGGIVGDTTELSNAKATIYDVYNKGQIGDETFTYYGRHVGGIVGRLSGDVDKAYNNGSIYNGFSVVGGIAGWWNEGNISNVFNTGNITVVNKNNGNHKGSEVGGIAGGVNRSIGKGSSKELSNAYNLGIIRSYYDPSLGGSIGNSIGGIIGNIHGDGGTDSLTIKNVYTLGKLYAGKIQSGGTVVDDAKGLGSIYGYYNNVDNGDGSADVPDGQAVTIENAYYINLPNNPKEGDTSDKDNYTADIYNNEGVTEINYGDRLSGGQYGGFDFGTDGDSSSSDGEWRIYEGSTTPILNAFMPDSSKYFGSDKDKSGLTEDEVKEKVQYGTAYDPLLTIINNNTTDLNINWNDLGMKGDASLVVYNENNSNKYGLTFTDFKNLGGTGFYSGTIYTDGDLTINGAEDADSIRFGSNSNLYGSSVTVNVQGNLEVYGNIAATGNL